MGNNGAAAGDVVWMFKDMLAGLVRSPADVVY